MLTGLKRASRRLLKTVKKAVHRPLIVAPVVVLVAVGVWLGWRSTHHRAEAAPSTVSRLLTVSTGTIRQTVAVSGTLQPAATEDLNFAVSGQVTAVNVKAGQTVAAGAVLATINSATLQSDVAQANATVAQDAAKVSSDDSSGASAAQVAADQANLNAANGALATAQANLADASLTSPIAGTVSVVNLTVGQQLGNSGGSGVSLQGTGTNSGISAATSASSSTPQVEVVSTGFVVNLSVDDTQISRLKVGQSATITLSTAATTTATGRAGRFGTAAAGATGAGATGGATTGAAGTGGFAGFGQGATGTVTAVGAVATSTDGVASFPVTVTVSGTPTGLYSGSTVEVAITYQEIDNVLEVPTAAITEKGGQSTVTVSVNGAKSTKQITTGQTSGAETQVESGLAAGDQVVVTVPVASTARSATTGAGATGGFAGFGGGGGGFGGRGGFGGGGGG